MFSYLYIIKGGNRMSVQENKLFYTVNELYEILPLGRNALYSLIKKEGFPKITVGRKILIPVKGFNLWVENNSFN